MANMVCIGDKVINLEQVTWVEKVPVRERSSTPGTEPFDVVLHFAFPAPGADQGATLVLDGNEAKYVWSHLTGWVDKG